MSSSKSKRQRPRKKSDEKRMMELIVAMRDSIPHGGLTWLATEIGMTPSGALKFIQKNRLHRPTLRAYNLIAENRLDKFMAAHPGAMKLYEEHRPPYIIHVFELHGRQHAVWSAAPAEEETR
jgi:hypothetical protein